MGLQWCQDQKNEAIYECCSQKIFLSEFFDTFLLRHFSLRNVVSLYDISLCVRLLGCDPDKGWYSLLTSSAGFFDWSEKSVGFWDLIQGLHLVREMLQMIDTGSGQPLAVVPAVTVVSGYWDPKVCALHLCLTADSCQTCRINPQDTDVTHKPKSLLRKYSHFW